MKPLDQRAARLYGLAAEIVRHLAQIQPSDESRPLAFAVDPWTEAGPVTIRDPSGKALLLARDPDDRLTVRFLWPSTDGLPFDVEQQVRGDQQTFVVTAHMTESAATIAENIAAQIPRYVQRFDQVLEARRVQLERAAQRHDLARRLARAAQIAESPRPDAHGTFTFLRAGAPHNPDFILRVNASERGIDIGLHNISPDASVAVLHHLVDLKLIPRSDAPAPRPQPKVSEPTKRRVKPKQ